MGRSLGWGAPCLLGWLVLISTGPAGAGDEPLPVGAEREVFAGRLDRNGTAVRVVLKKTAETEEAGEFFQLRVLAGSKPIWQGPEKSDPEDPLVFGSWHFGSREPVLFEDLDGDGRREMLVNEPQGDVSPATFQRYTWTGSAFQRIQSGLALLETDNGSDRYLWRPYDGGYNGRWIMGLSLEPKGAIHADIYDVRTHEDREEYLTGTASVAPIPDGFQVQGWVTPLTRSE